MRGQRARIQRFVDARDALHFCPFLSLSLSPLASLLFFLPLSFVAIVLPEKEKKKEEKNSFQSITGLRLWTFDSRNTNR